jgi:DNA/RNA endonuclease YhcR with UshA esterase domain
MSIPRARLPWVALLLMLAACGRETLSLDSGQPSTLMVRAYVDDDGSGAFNAGDLPITGAEIKASSDAGSFSATTDGSGVAAFAALPPGSYALAMAGNPPAGAVLTTASNPVVAAPYRTASLTSEFRYAWLAGVVSGRLFRDDNGSGAWEAGEDLAAAGIAVTLSAGATAAGNVGAAVAAGNAATAVILKETVTGADGAFRFEALRPGSYTVDMSLLPTMMIAGGPSFPVTVGAGEDLQLSAMFTGTLRIDIIEARDAADGQTVSVEGIVTWHPGFDTRQLFLQDGTGGISAFDGTRPTADVGDRVQITGERSVFDGEVQIGNVASFVNLGPEGEPEPRPVTAAEIDAGKYQGELVTIDGTVEQIDVLSFDNQMLLLRDGSGGAFAVRVDSRTGTASGDWTVGETYALTGVLGTDESESGTDIEDDHPHRLETRGPADIVAGGSIVSIADARAMSGESVVVQGVITWQNEWDDRVFFFQDATGGLSAFYSGAPGLQRGDLVQIRGAISVFRGETQISPTDLKVLGNIAVPPPVGATGAQIMAGDFQGMLVTVTGTIQAVDEVDSFGNQVVTLRDGAGTDIPIYVDSRSGVVSASWPAAGSQVRVTGVLGNDDRTGNTGPRIELRDIDDIAMVNAGVTSMAEARAMPSGTVVTVEGTVSWQTPWDKRTYFFQDATGGLSTFHSGAPDLLEGDHVTVTGEVAAFRGELQLGNITDIQVVTPGPAPTPRVVSGAQINAGLFQGELVQATGSLMEVLTLSFDNQRVTIRDGFGTDFAVYVDSRNGMVAGDWPAIGTTVRVTGVLGTDDRNQDEGRGPRIENRSAGDVTVVTAAAGR